MHTAPTEAGMQNPIQWLASLGLSDGQAWGALTLAGLVLLLVLLLVARGLMRAKRPSIAPTSYPYAGMATVPIGDLGRESTVNPQPSAPLQWDATLPPQKDRVRPPASLRIPDGFDVDEFVRSAKQQFIKLQAAWDAGQREVLRELTTSDLYGHILLGLGDRPGSESRTEVVSLDADVLGVQGPQGEFDELAVIRFRGVLREALESPAQSFDEIWNLARKPGSPWLLAGIERLTLGQTGSQYADPNATIDPYAGPQTLQQIF